LLKFYVYSFRFLEAGVELIKNFYLVSRFARIVFWVACMAALFTINAGAEVIYVKQHNGSVIDGSSWDRQCGGNGWCKR